jgi:serine/threonine protein kinase
MLWGWELFCQACSRTHAPLDVEPVDVVPRRNIPVLDADDLGVEKAVRCAGEEVTATSKGNHSRHSPSPKGIEDLRLEAGDFVSVNSKLTSSNKACTMVLIAGQRGQVIEIDSDGDAKIYFGGYGTHWILRSDWRRLSKEDFAGDQDDFFGEARPSFHQLYEIKGAFGTAVSGQTHKVSRVDEDGTELYQDTTSNGLCVKIRDLGASTNVRIGKRDRATQEELCEAMQERLACELTVIQKVSAEEEGREHILRFVDYFLESGISYVVLDGMGSATVLQALEACPVLTERDLAQVFQKMLQAIAYLDRCRVVHRDIQPGRFTCTPTTKVGAGLMLRLCDFTCAAQMPEDGSKLTEICGTPAFMSPEMLREIGYDSSTDVWSFGVTAYVLMFGHFPYQPTVKTAKALREVIAEGTTMPSFQPSPPLSRFQVGSAATTFVQRLLFRETFGRYTPQKALEDDWLSVSVALGSEGAEGLPSMFPALGQAKRHGLFGVRPTRQPGKEVVKTKQNAGSKSRLGKVLVDKQHKHHGSMVQLGDMKFCLPSPASEWDDARSTTTGTTETFDSDFGS